MKLINIKNLRRLLPFLPLLLLTLALGCKPSEPKDYLNETQAELDERMEWWRDGTFGMFIHWGAYAVPAGIHNGEEVPGIGEWIMERGKISIEEYEKYVHQFNPVKYDANEWARIASDAGMKYMVITSKHHDGFCLWDSKVSDYDVMDAAPIQRDLLKELAVACKKHGVKLCFYHSIMDWHHPDANKESFAKYREEYLIPQLDELLSGDYGDIGVLWFDGEWISEWTEDQGKALYQHLREVKPDLIINNRVGKGRQGMQGMNKDRSYAGDFGTPEQEILETASALDWESCMTMNNTWGFKKNDHDWKSAEMLIHNLVDIIAKGGNYLLNVGPTAEGLIPAESVERLAEMGEWIRVNEEAIYKTQRFEHYKEGEKIRYIQDKKGKYVYAVAFEWPGESFDLNYAKPKEGSKIELLGYSGKLDWEYSLEEGLKIIMPEELADPKKRPCKYAWVFKMQAGPAGVVIAPTVTVKSEENPKTVVFFDKVEFSVETPKGSKAYYTLDGSKPNESSSLYSQALTLNESTTLKVLAVEVGKSSSEMVTVRFVQSNKYKATATITSPSPKYPGKGIKGFLSYGDGIRGSIKDIQDGNWVGFEGYTMSVCLELEDNQTINRIEAGFLQKLGSWIFLPDRVSFFAGDAQNAMKNVGEIEYTTPANAKEIKVVDMGIDLSGIKAKYIKVTARTVGTIPEWHPGAGGSGWLFCDEIIIN